MRRKNSQPKDARLVVDTSSVGALALCHLDESWTGCLSTPYFLPRGSDLQYRFRDAELVDLYHHTPRLVSYGTSGLLPQSIIAAAQALRSRYRSPDEDSAELAGLSNKPVVVILTTWVQRASKHCIDKARAYAIIWFSAGHFKPTRCRHEHELMLHMNWVISLNLII